MVTTCAIGIVAYFVGVAVSPYFLPIDFLSSKLQQQQNPNGSIAAPTPASPPTSLPRDEKSKQATSRHELSYKAIVKFNDYSDPFPIGLDIVVHRNGEPDPCSRQEVAPKESADATALGPMSQALVRAAGAHMKSTKRTLDVYKKYDVDAVLTHALIVGKDDKSLLQGRGYSCGPTWTNDQPHYMDYAPHLKDKSISSMIKYCDMGQDKTPKQLDHDKLLPVPEIGSLPCHFHTREGLRITSLAQLAQLAREAKVPAGECTVEERNNGSCTDNDAKGGELRREFHLYAVPAGRVFMFAPKYVGEIFELPHVKVPKDLPVWLEVISLSPRVFDVFNFFDREESAAIVDKALKETSETHRIKRSSTGASGYNVNSQRTSENGFDTHGKQAQAVKHRW
jgi:hypothetical protein